jgi:NitT/TauT family transport system permease protein
MTWGVPLVLALLLLGCWEIAARTRMISPLFFPAPSTILQALGKLTLSGVLAENLGATLFRVVTALVLGGGAGLVSGWLLGASDKARLALEPFVSAFHPLPKLAMFPLFLVLLGIGEESKVAVIAVSVFFPVLINTQAGVRHIDRSYWDVARNYGAGRWKLLTRVILPGSLPMTLVGFKLGLNMALMLAIAVEMLSARTGLGSLIWDSWNSLRTPNLFAVLFVMMALGVAGNALFTLLFRATVPWQEKETT